MVRRLGRSGQELADVEMPPHGSEVSIGQRSQTRLTFAVQALLTAHRALAEPAKTTGIRTLPLNPSLIACRLIPAPETSRRQATRRLRNSSAREWRENRVVLWRTNGVEQPSGRARSECLEGAIREQRDKRFSYHQPSICATYRFEHAEIDDHAARKPVSREVAIISRSRLLAHWHANGVIADIRFG